MSLDGSIGAPPKQVAKSVPEAAPGAGVRGPMLTSLVLEHLIPATFWMVVLVAKMLTLFEYLSSSAVSQPTLGVAARVLYQTLTIALIGMCVVLFLARRPVLGRRATWQGRVVALIGTFVLYVPAAVHVGDVPTTLLLTSSAIILTGSALSLISLRTLDRCFGVFPEARGLVTAGPYTYIRHPLYLGEIVVGLGLVLATRWVPLVGLFVLLCVFQYWRAGLEERALTVVFPEYADYSRRTWRIIPLVL